MGFKGPYDGSYRREVDRQAGFLVDNQVDYVDRRQNEATDALSRLGLQRKPVPPNVFPDVLTKPSVQPPAEQDIAEPDPQPALVAAIHATPDWVVPYLDYKTRGILPVDELLARQIVRRSESFTIINGELHRRSATDVFRDTSHQKKEEPSSMKYFLVILDIMPALARLWTKPTNTASTGLRHMWM